MGFLNGDFYLLRDEPGYRSGEPGDDTYDAPEPDSELEDRRRTWKARRERVATARYWARARAEREASGLPELTHALDGTGAFCPVSLTEVSRGVAGKPQKELPVANGSCNEGAAVKGGRS